MTPWILAEDTDHTWLYKPPGVPVFPRHDDPTAPSLAGFLAELRPEGPAFPAGFEHGLAHRLDIPTSGVVLACRTLEALTAARALFAEGRLRKHYRFVSRGEVPWDAHVVTTRLAHHKKDRRRMVTERGRNTPHRGRWYPAHTELARDRDGRWKAVITTGVMHQIRAHAASVGLALDGDRLYGGAPTGAPFQLHHCRIEGIRGCPFAPPP